MREKYGKQVKKYKKKYGPNSASLPKGASYFIISYKVVHTRLALSIALGACADLSPMFGLAPPLVAEVCFGGGIEVYKNLRGRPCPVAELPYALQGNVFWEKSLYLDCWICAIVFAKIEISAHAGYDEIRSNACSWKDPSPGGGWFGWRRRRRLWRCESTKKCHGYVKGRLSLTLAVIRAQIEVIWYRGTAFQVILKLLAWAWYWYEVYAVLVVDKKLS